MNQSRPKLWVFIVCVLAFGLMTLNAGTALGAEWFLEGKELKTYSGGKLELPLSAEIEGTSGSFLSEIGGVPLKVLCTAVSLIGANLITGGSFLAGATAKYSGCIFFGKEVELKACEPVTGKEKGVIVTNRVKGGLSGANTVVLEPEVAGQTFKVFNTGEECAFGEKIPVYGKLLLTDTELGVEKVKHLVKLDSSSMYVISQIPEHAVVIDGSGLMFLSGAHTGLKLSGK